MTARVRSLLRGALDLRSIRGRLLLVVGMLLAHGARAWRSGQPAVGIHLHVGVSERRHAVRLRLR